MGEVEEIIIDEEKANKILKKIIILESTNIKNKRFNDVEMVKKIKKTIEEEVECYSNP